MSLATNDRISALKNVNVQVPASDFTLPFMISPKGGEDLVKWAINHQNLLFDLLIEHGAILFRGMKIGSASAFDELFSKLCGGSIEYINRTSPRDKVVNNVYTSTTYPKEHPIHMHTENSYSPEFNRIIGFFCLKPPMKGGETPIAEERLLLKELPAETVSKFRDKKILYVRNLVDGIGIDWQTAYQTSDRNEVNRRLESSNISYEWISEDHLRTKWVLPAVINHPITGEEVWFNHMYFYHKSLYDPSILEYFEDEDLPFSSYYGDGSKIEDEVINAIRQFYQRYSIVFKW
ncbi:MAG: TauD/TfdA family dioxygenase, partial [Ekhidna sp.]